MLKVSDCGIFIKLISSEFLDFAHCLVLQTKHNISQTDSISVFRSKDREAPTEWVDSVRSCMDPMYNQWVLLLVYYLLE
jgi:hypothetical protein